MRTMTNHPFAARVIAACCSLALCCGLAACGDSNASDSKLDDVNQIPGLTAEGEPGEKPTISFHAPMTVEDGAYAILQKGNGDAVEIGDRVCAQYVAVNTQDGSEMLSTWEDDTPDCSILVTQDNIDSSALYELIARQRINATFAVGVNDSDASYIMALTLVSKSQDYTRATGEPVADVPADLPIVTLDEDGKPSIDMNGQGDVDELVVQPLIKGDGAVVESDDTVRAHYTGWLLDGTQFDSSWDRGEPSDFALSDVIAGWQEGLAGQTVGSQVLLVVPPDKGYGSSGSGDTIPGDATLVFVVDILAAY
ncbi:FKBP-type peptidyl-prolyl cis-trans isomerase [Bifidobacterium phasiani]|uniref:Peptidyl-prolyl cis-trans isomerase n=1 Tax=Bifidobacterium phasiani TaxID=2834431 RepID=A0ABS6W9Q2_9BIFI|nr:FKBP-type peptidyl-prolyl cis-trans isomerase [Bifidobacterium phasiani]MBW3083233.1 FKBP-type peptidyl-prolyl cis-trans isomerase [Bifidobacterium phasiani]